MTVRSNHYVKGPIVSILAALSVAAFGCLGTADAAEPVEEQSAELASDPGATQTISTAVLYLKDSAHISGTLAVIELTDPAGPDYDEAINFVDEASYDLVVARGLLVNRSRTSPAEFDRRMAELAARQKARAERLAARGR